MIVFAQRIMRCLHIAAASLIGVLCLLTIVDVIRRAVFGKSLVGVVEITEFLMVGIVFLSLAYTEVRKEHVKVEILTIHFTPATQVLLKIILLALGSIFVALVLWQGILDTVLFWQIGEYKFGPGNLRLFKWPAMLMVPFGCFWFLLQLVINILQQVQLLRSRFGDKREGS